MQQHPTHFSLEKVHVARPWLKVFGLKKHLAEFKPIIALNSNKNLLPKKCFFFNQIKLKLRLMLTQPPTELGLGQSFAKILIIFFVEIIQSANSVLIF